MDRSHNLNYKGSTEPQLNNDVSVGKTPRKGKGFVYSLLVLRASDKISKAFSYAMRTTYGEYITVCDTKRASSNTKGETCTYTKINSRSLKYYLARVDFASEGAPTEALKTYIRKCRDHGLGNCDIQGLVNEIFNEGNDKTNGKHVFCEITISFTITLFYIWPENLLLFLSTESPPGTLIPHRTHVDFDDTANINIMQDTLEPVSLSTVHFTERNSLTPSCSVSLQSSEGGTAFDASSVLPRSKNDMQDTVEVEQHMTTLKRKREYYYFVDHLMPFTSHGNCSSYFCIFLLMIGVLFGDMCPIWVCHNAMLLENKCMFVQCNDCHDVKVQSSKNGESLQRSG